MEEDNLANVQEGRSADLAAGNFPGKVVIPMLKTLVGMGQNLEQHSYS
jgi:hypothetical protein